MDNKIPLEQVQETSPRGFITVENDKGGKKVPSK